MIRGYPILASTLAGLLAVAGCGRTPTTTPSLYSTNRDERLQAVKAAAEKYGSRRAATVHVTNR